MSMNECWSYHALRNLPLDDFVLTKDEDGNDRLAVVVSKNEDGMVTVIERNNNECVL